MNGPRMLAAEAMLLLAWILLGASATPAWAQKGRFFISAEAFVGTADSVHLGKIVEIERIEYEPAADQPLTRIQGYGKPYRLVFGVNETIRGEPPESGRVVLILSMQSTHYLEYLRERAAELMLVGGAWLGEYPSPKVGIEENGRRVDGRWYHFRGLEPLEVPDAAIDRRGAALSEQLNRYFDHYGMFTTELEVVRGREAILKRVRAFAKRHGNKPMGVTVFLVPNEFAALCGTPTAFSKLLLPICPSTEKTLRAFQKNPELLFGRIEGEIHYEKFHREQYAKHVAEALEPFED